MELNVQDSMGSLMSYRIENSGDTVTVILEGELDHHATKGVREEIDETIGKLRPKLLILDFQSVTFMDSSGIGLVMGRYRTMQLFGGKVTIRGASMHIRKVMRLAGLDRLAEFR